MQLLHIDHHEPKGTAGALALTAILGLSFEPQKAPAQPTLSASVANPGELSKAGKALDTFHQTLQKGDRKNAWELYPKTP